MERLGSVARRFGLEILSAIVTVESMIEVAFRHESQRPTWFAVSAIGVVVAPLLARRRFPFCAPAAVFVLAAAISFADGLVIATPASAFLAAMIASFLLGNLPDGRQARIGLIVVLCGAAIVVDHKPGHARGDLFFFPMPSAWTSTSTRPSAPAPAASCSRMTPPNSSSPPSAPSPPGTRCSPPRSPNA